MGDSPIIRSANVYEGDAVFTNLLEVAIAEKGWTHILDTSWHTNVGFNHDTPIFDQLPTRKIFAGPKGSCSRVLYEFDNLFMVVTFQGDRKYIDIRAAASDLKLIDAAFEAIQEAHPEVKKEEKKVSVTFWNNSAHGGQATEREIDVERWENIERNYPVGESRDALDNLLTLQNFSEENGKLILFWGDPGSGKTHLVRSLIREWRDWCTAEYIVDPDVFFSTASYMMSVLLKSPDEDYFLPPDPLNGETHEDKQKWRLLICEDTGELLSVDAAERTGQSLSKCLNIVDGMVGQGLKIILLITTNQKLGKLHPAVSRPGRTHSVLHFDNFSATEASEWLGSPVDKPTSLAELYALRGNHSNNSKSANRRPIGFHV